jgi:hypothetical protein
MPGHFTTLWESRSISTPSGQLARHATEYYYSAWAESVNNTLYSSHMLQPYPKQEMCCVVCCHWHTATLAPSAGPMYSFRLDRIILCTGTLAHCYYCRTCISGDIAICCIKCSVGDCNWNQVIWTSTYESICILKAKVTCRAGLWVGRVGRLPRALTSRERRKGSHRLVTR